MLIDYLGYRLVAMSVMPLRILPNGTRPRSLPSQPPQVIQKHVSRPSLVYGSDDAVSTLHYDEGVHALMKEVFGRLNLGEHQVGAQVVVPHAMDIREVRQRARHAFNAARARVEAKSRADNRAALHGAATPSPVGDSRPLPVRSAGAGTGTAERDGGAQSRSAGGNESAATSQAAAGVDMGKGARQSAGQSAALPSPPGVRSAVAGGRPSTAPVPGYAPVQRTASGASSSWRAVAAANA